MPSGHDPMGGYRFSEKIVLRQQSRRGVPHAFEEELILRMFLSPISSGGSCREQKCPISASPESP
jgi:hypothetical protein